MNAIAQGVPEQTNASYDELYAGYESLAEAHAELLYELALAKNENVRFPFFTLPEKVAVDVVDKLMEII